MSAGVFQPVGQKRLTNIAVVRLKKGGKRFEIACYKNKVGDWRNGIEKDLDEVLQTTTIFTNVSKGIVAKEKELQAAFGTAQEDRVCLEILAKGELQVSEKERKTEYDSLFRDVAGVLVEKCINPESSRPYTITMMERALRDVHFAVDPKRPAKQQALEALPALRARFPIERARMRLRLSTPAAAAEELLEHLEGLGDALVESTDRVGVMFSVVVQVEPGVFRELHNFLQSAEHRQGRIEVLSMAVMSEGARNDEFSTPQATAAASLAADVYAHTRATAAQAQEAVAAASASTAAVAPTASTSSVTSSSTAAAPPQHGGTTPRRVAAGGVGSPSASPSKAVAGDVLYPRGPVAGIPDEFAARKERFTELDTLQGGWTVELKSKGETVDAVFYSPTGAKVGAYANARRAALQAHKASQQ